MTIKAHFDGKVLVPDEPVELKPGERLVLHVERADEAQEGGMTGAELAGSGIVGIWADREDFKGKDSTQISQEWRRRIERREL
jgi:hypothetical protein